MLINTFDDSFMLQVVRHLPLSSQIEYRQLVQRMKILEKQKIARDPSRVRSKANLNAGAKTFVPTATNTVASRLDSLVKQVLVKTANNAQSAKQALINSKPTLEPPLTAAVEPEPTVAVEPMICVAETIVTQPENEEVDLKKQKDALLKTELEMAKHRFVCVYTYKALLHFNI